MQKQEKIFFKGHRSTFWIKMPFGIGHPPRTHQLQSTCVGEGSRVPNLQTEFNYLDLFKSYDIFTDCCPHGPHVVPVMPTSSLCHPHHPHVIPIAPRRSPRGPNDLWSPLSPWSPPHVVPVVLMLSPLSPHHPRVVPIIPTSCRRSPHHP